MLLKPQSPSPVTHLQQGYTAYSFSSNATPWWLSIQIYESMGPLSSKQQFIILKGSKLKVSGNEHDLIPIYSFKTYLFTSRKKDISCIPLLYLLTWDRVLLCISDWPGICWIELAGLKFTEIHSLLLPCAMYFKYLLLGRSIEMLCFQILFVKPNFFLEINFVASQVIGIVLQCTTLFYRWL